MPVVAALVPAAIGAYQAISGGIKAKKARKALENQKTPIEAPDKGILDYYKEAQNRYNTSAQNSSMYQANKANAGAALASGVNALQDRRSALAGIGSLTSAYSNNLNRGLVQAENMKNQQFSTLGNATRMNASDNSAMFRNNRLMPYQANRAIYSAQLQGANQITNSGIQNIGNGLQSAGKIYADNSNNGLDIWGNPAGGE